MLNKKGAGLIACTFQTVEKVGQPQANYNFNHLNFKEVLIQKQATIKSDI